MFLMNWQKDGAVAILTMTNGANKMNLDFAQALLAALDEVEADQEVKALILTSDDQKNFSQGIDTAWLGARFNAGELEVVKSFLYGMNQIFTRLLLFPLPVIAAINGHAYGNGAIMSCACDFRFMRADKGFFCFPEVNVGIPFLPGMLAFVSKAVPQDLLQEMALTGRALGAPELAERRVLVASCADLDDLMTRSLEFAKGFDKKRGIFGEMKRRFYARQVQVIADEDPKYIEPLNVMVGY
ncbi:MAG: enoyl-CoA hydratase/isomerase family protein [Deltaproteobacteria bacterium]|nr:enoyl-CoA hydratase/isomerase family protein [Deltaproteobacteria bacterium]